VNDKAIIVDIDGTLSNPNHRRYLVEGENKDLRRLMRTLLMSGVIRLPIDFGLIMILFLLLVGLKNLRMVLMLKRRLLVG